jgi:hypothetical protein
MSKKFYFISQVQLAALEFDKHLAIRRAMEESLIDLLFEPLKISDMG